MIEEGEVSQVLESGGVVGHDIGLSWEEKDLVTVAMLALVFAGEGTEVARGTLARHSTFGDSCYSWRVVTAICQGGISHVRRGGHEGDLPHEASLL